MAEKIGNDMQNHGVKMKRPAVPTKVYSAVDPSLWDTFIKGTLLLVLASKILIQSL